LSLADSTAGDPLATFVLYLVIEQVRWGELDVRGTGYKIMNNGGKDELRIKKSVGTPEDRKARDL
jgi:hypothetical protein